MKLLMEKRPGMRGGLKYRYYVFNALYPNVGRYDAPEDGEADDIFYHDDASQRQFPHADKTRRVRVIHHLDDGVVENLAPYLQVVTVSPYWHNYLLERQGVESTIIYNCYNEMEVNPVRSESRESLRRALGFVNKKYVYTGLKAKPIASLPRADGIEYIATDGSLEYSEYLRLLRACDAGVFSSEWPEGWSRVSMECLLVGTPCLIRNNTGMGDLLRMSGQPELNGDLIEQIETICAERDKYAAIGWENLKHLTFANFKQEWSALYERLVGR
jgi:glycosyltransferase involved in cell wall biosynthesis